MMARRRLRLPCGRCCRDHELERRQSRKRSPATSRTWPPRRLDEATWYDELEAMWGRKWGACEHRQAPHCHAPPKPTSRHFGAERVIHEFERAAQPNAEIILEGEDDHTVGSARILFTPGHTKGHTVLLWRDEYLFVGDHFGTRAVCWHSWDAQIESTRKLEVLIGVEWVFHGHGKWLPVPSGDFPNVIGQRVREMAAER